MKPGRAPFRERDNISEDDAKRILEALKDRESSLQKHFLKQKEDGSKGYGNDNGKDW